MNRLMTAIERKDQLLSMKRLNKLGLQLYARTELALAALLAALVGGATDASSKSTDTAIRKYRFKAVPGQATLEWVLIGGILVVIIIALLLTIFKPQIETIMQNILNLVQQNTSSSGS